MKPHLVLIVDDIASIRNTVKAHLTALGFEVIEAENGKEALRKLKTDNPELAFILTDLNMPELDGFGLIQHTRKLEAYQHTPIFMLTNERRESKKQEGKMLGATAWLEKPFNRKTFEHLLEHFSLHPYVKK